MVFLLMGYNYITFTSEEDIVQRSVSINNVLSALRDDRKLHWLGIIGVSWGSLSLSSFFHVPDRQRSYWRIIFCLKVKCDVLARLVG